MSKSVSLQAKNRGSLRFVIGRGHFNSHEGADVVGIDYGVVALVLRRLEWPQGHCVIEEWHLDDAEIIEHYLEQRLHALLLILSQLVGVLKEIVLDARESAIDGVREVRLVRREIKV